jgi:hypothetical protein
MYAEMQKALGKAADDGIAEAKAASMAEMEREFGDKAPAVMTKSRQAFQFFAERARLSQPQMEMAARSMVLDAGKDGAPGDGDALVMRMWAAVAEAMGEDGAVALTRGGPLTDTPAEARAKLAEFVKDGGDWARAVKENNLTEIARLKPQYEALARKAVQ